MSELSPDICIVIAAWNAEQTIETALDSALGQRGVNVEVIAVDDCSSDGTAELLHERAARDSRLRVFAQTKNCGPAAARNRAISESRAPFVTILDSDDAMAPDRLFRLLEILRSGAWDIVADDLYKVSAHGPGHLRQRLWTEYRIGMQQLTFGDFIWGNLSTLHGGRGELGFLKPLISRDFLVRNHLAYDEHMRLGEDYALYATALAAGARFCLTDPAGYYALTRPESLSECHSSADLRALFQADRMLARLPSLTARDRNILTRHRIETQKRWSWLRLIEAVKARNAREAAQCFFARPSVVTHLCLLLAEQSVLRSTATVRRALRTGRA